MKTLVIGGIAGYIAGDKVFGKMSAKLEEKLKLGFGTTEYSAIIGSIVYFVRPLPDNMNMAVAGFCFGTALANLM